MTDGWQSIDTAPKGVDVLIARADRPEWGPDIACLHEDGEWCDSDGSTYYEPTHWMPLPAPPGGPVSADPLPPPVPPPVTEDELARVREIAARADADCDLWANRSAGVRAAGMVGANYAESAATHGLNKLALFAVLARLAWLEKVAEALPTREQLLDAEWGDSGYGCPVCGMKSIQEHTPDCWIARLLAARPALTGGEG